METKNMCVCGQISWEYQILPWNSSSENETSNSEQPAAPSFLPGTSLFSLCSIHKHHTGQCLLLFVCLFINSFISHTGLLRVSRGATFILFIGFIWQLGINYYKPLSVEGAVITHICTSAFVPYKQQHLIRYTLIYSNTLTCCKSTLLRPVSALFVVLRSLCCSRLQLCVQKEMYKHL